MKILVYRGKYGDEYWLADTFEQMEAALKALFNLLDGYGFYDCDEEDGLTAARAGDKTEIFALLSHRRRCEYEGWEIVEAVDPCTN